MKKIELNWLEEFSNKWRAGVSEGRQPHAVMLLGPPGTGKRMAARWMGRLKLGRTSTDKPELLEGEPEIPDLRIVGPLEDKTTIGIDQIRSLISNTSLTSHGGRGKVAIIEPANAMTREAANSLLKTLEEPLGDALMILVADRTGRLPATIFSRCQQIGIPVPDASTSLAWLDRVSPGHDWRVALDFAGGAPLKALELADSLDLMKEMEGDLRELACARGSPMAVAARWSKLDTPLVLNWLTNQVQKVTKARSGCQNWAGVLGLDNSMLEHMDTRKLFCYLDIINRLRASPKGSFNVQLALERLLIDWSSGLAHVGWRENYDGLSHIQSDGRTL